MKFSCERSDLLAAINIAAKAASSKSPIPALEGILIETGMDCVKLTGYDLKKAIYTKAEARVWENGSVVLGARIFGDIIRSLPDGTVSIKTDGLNVSITCEKSDFNIVGTDAADYPELPAIESSTGVSLPQGLLSEMIRQTIFAVSDNESRPVYTGELFEISGDELTVVSVDGYRLALRKEKVEGAGEDCSFIVPGSALSDIERICSNNEEDMINIAVGGNHVSFTVGNTVVVTRRLEGDFLNYKKAVPENFKYEIKLSRTDLLRAVDRVSLIVSEKTRNPVRMNFSDGIVECRCSTPIGNAEDMCICEGNGEDMEIGFNDKYLMDALKAAPADEICVCLNSGSAPCVILPADKECSFKYMILPIKLRK